MYRPLSVLLYAMPHHEVSLSPCSCFSRSRPRQWSHPVVFVPTLTGRESKYKEDIRGNDVGGIRANKFAKDALTELRQREKHLWVAFVVGERPILDARPCTSSVHDGLVRKKPTTRCTSLGGSVLLMKIPLRWVLAVNFHSEHLLTQSKWITDWRALQVIHCSREEVPNVYPRS